MKKLIASVAALGLLATPVAAAQTKAPAPAKTTKVSKSIVKEAKAEGESVKTEVAEHKAAARHHGKLKKHHAKTIAAKTAPAKKPATTTKKS